MESLFFDNWGVLGRTLIVGVLAYVALVAVLRISGNRTLSKMNAFDFIITVALGSTLATILLSPEVALAEGILALCLLVGLQYTVTWLSARSPWVRQMVKSRPILLVYQGKFLRDEMRSARVVEDEIVAALREQGIGSPKDVTAVILETEGSFSILPSGSGVETLDNVRHVPSRAKLSD